MTPTVYQITSANADSVFPALWAIYDEAIPKSEQRSADYIRSTFDRPDYANFVIESNGIIMGFIMFIRARMDGIWLLEYMAVSHLARGQGLGSVLINHALQFFDNQTIIIEIDSPDEDGLEPAELKKRHDRIRFYARSNARLIEGFYYKLPIVSDHEPPLMNLMMIGYDETQNRLSSKTLEGWVEAIYDLVYHPNLPLKSKNWQAMFGTAPDYYTVKTIA